MTPLHDEFTFEELNLTYKQVLEGILSNAIVADIAKNDGDKTGEYKEGMFFAVQTFMNKLGQMIAMVVFSSILLLGKDPGQDLGIRLTGIIAASIGLIALLIFTRFREE